jgi:dephospho-CoA kinase
MLKVGLTGGIGSGKTTVSNHIKELGFPVYNSDSRAKWLMNNDPDIKNLVVLEFGVSAYEKGVLNRKLISEIVFSDSSKLKKLNSVIHPAVAEDFKNWITQYDSNTIVFKEAAILIESKAY